MLLMWVLSSKVDLRAGWAVVFQAPHRRIYVVGTPKHINSSDVSGYSADLEVSSRLQMMGIKIPSCSLFINAEAVTALKNRTMQSDPP